MKTYRMVVFEGYLEDITRKFNVWASDDDGIDIIRIEFCPGRFTKDGEQGLIVIYKKDTYKTKKTNSDACEPVVERPTAKELCAKHMRYMREKDPLTIFDPLIDRLDEEDKND